VRQNRSPIYRYIRILAHFFNCFSGAIRELLKYDEDILKCFKTFIPERQHLFKV
jgi:hypothetical protein